MLGAVLWAQAPGAAQSSAQPPAAQPSLIHPVAPGTPAPAAADPVVFTAAGESMTRSQFEHLLSTLPQQTRTQTATPEGKRMLADRLADLKILAQEARSRGLQSNPEVANELKTQEDSLLANVMFQQLVQSAQPNEAELKAAYEARQAKGDFDQAKARHILVRIQGSRIPVRKDQKDLTDAEALARAQALRERLVKGEDFAALAKTESDDTVSGAKGGDLGTLGRGRMIPDFEKAVFALKAGDISEPVKTQYGYHLIQVQERTVTPFEKVKPDLERDLKNEMATRTLRAMREKSNVKFNPDYFGMPKPSEIAPAANVTPGTPAEKK
jgi:peptidyl-prolyl cis-trans isomerase C